MATQSLTARTIIKHFLYNSNGTPTEFVTDRLIRPNDEGEPITLSMQSYMDAEGRFALPSLALVVKKFFSFVGDLGVFLGGFPEGRDVLEVSLASMCAALNADSNFSIQHYNYNDGDSDYLERTFVFNSAGFKLSDETRFFISKTGERWIENMSVRAFDDNFDFESNSLLAQIGNSFIQPKTDPSNIGRTVDIIFTGDVRAIDRYDIVKYQNDLLTDASNFTVTDVFGLVAPLNTLLQDIFDEGITKFLDSSNRPIFYGTVKGDTITADSIDATLLDAFRSNGVVLIGGVGNDMLTGGGAGKDELYGGDGADRLSGGAGNDKLYGEEGDDYLEGGAGDDRLEGGENYDSYYVNVGAASDVNDIIRDTDGRGGVFAGSIAAPGAQLIGGREDKAECAPENTSQDEKTYTDDAGNIYQTSSGNLIIIFAAGGGVTIENWSNGQLGINLQPANASGGGSGGAGGGGGGDHCEPPQSNASPLVLDLDGDGVEISTRFSRSVYFDIDNDGIKERSNWVLPDDGLLALDRNGNGVIDDANELFGALIAESERQIPHFVYVEATCH